MSYDASTAPWSYWQLLSPALLAIYACALVVLAISPAPVERAIITPRRRLLRAGGALLCLTLAALIVIPIAKKTARCSGEQVSKDAEIVEGILHIVDESKAIRLQIGEREFISNTSLGASECGLRASLAQSVTLKAGVYVRAVVVSGTVIKLQTL